MDRESISGRTATIKVGRGPHAGVFTVPKALLCNSSTYFKAALNGPFVEGQTQTIDLDDEDPSIFRTYVAWLYQGQLHSQDIEEELDDPQDFGLHIAQVMVFADRRDVAELQDDAMSMLLDYLMKTGLPTLEVINCIYTMPKSAEIDCLRWLLARKEIQVGERLEENIDHWHPEFLAKIIKTYKDFDSDSIEDTSTIDSSAWFCKLTHKHATNELGCSSLVKNEYVTTPSTQEPPKKKRKIEPSAQTVVLLDD
jgi:hypothetical protein